ncbi:hypothetical protein [Mesoterricola silvestris]|uniref:Photosynthesis system II assembly factor Ycf48/Hcf136-like domain-containing protein n=1 Tax=Mesoterricola silvestris TaxID=2927979 RepID=A0AA48GPU0_9BACT|nr:hypothetical protein [Mesoterricola silvestris]BDU71955.1 hypothetical protein METEAL_11290 [Mesoterricola silvestris]
MDRSGFLKTFGMLAAGTVLARGESLKSLARRSLDEGGAASRPVQVPAATLEPGTHPPRYRGETGGRILVTTDAGATWQTHANLGPDIVVIDVLPTAKGTFAHLDYRGLPFRLKLSADGRSWISE